MKQKHSYLEVLLLASVALILIGTAALSLHVDLLYAICPSPEWAKRSVVLRNVIAISGSAIAVAAICSFVLIWRGGRTLCSMCFVWIRSVAKELREMWTWLCERTDIKNSWAWLLLVTATGLGVRCYFLAQPMRYDEAFTFLNFVNKPLVDLLSYPYPNNHILHTLLVRISVAVFGSDPVAIRLPALIAGVLVIPLVFLLSRLMSRNPRSGFLASASVAVFPYLVLYDTMARGYSIVLLLSLLLAIVAIRLVEHPSSKLCLPIALFTAFGLLDIPIFIFPAAGIISWVVLGHIRQRYSAKWILSRVLAPCTVMTIAFTCLFYTPTIIASNGIEPLISNRYVKGLSWMEFLNRLPDHASDIANDLTRDIPLVVVTAGLLLLALGFYSLARKRRWNSFMFLPMLATVSVVVLFAKHAIPFARVWIYLIPFTIVFVDIGYSSIPKSTCLLARGALLVLTWCLAILLMSRNVIASYPDTGCFPEAPVVAAVLSRHISPGDQLVVKVPADAPLYYYMWKRGIPYERRLPRRTSRFKVFIITKPSKYTLTDLGVRRAQRLIEIEDAAIYVAVVIRERRSQH